MSKMRGDPDPTIRLSGTPVHPDPESYQRLIEEITQSIHPCEKCGRPLLYPREVEVLRLRLGLDRSPPTPRSLEDTGMHLGLSRGRIRQIEMHALIRIREAGSKLEVVNTPPNP